MTMLSDWWTLALAKVGLPATLLLACYVLLCLGWVIWIAHSAMKAIRYQVGGKRRLRVLHSSPVGVVRLADRAAKRRQERGA